MRSEAVVAILSMVGSSALAGCSSEPLDAAATSGGFAGRAGSNSASSAVGAPVGGYSATAYPPGPYGRNVGSVIENHEFLGWHDPVSSAYDPQRFEVVRLSDFYNPSANEARPKLIVINGSAVWCAVCRAEFRHLRDNDIYARYRPQGVEIIGSLFEDNEYQPAKPTDLALWGSIETHAVEFPLVLDPGFKLGAYFAGDVTPLNMIVDARTMKIIDVTMGYDPSTDSSYWQLVDRLLAAP